MQLTQFLSLTAIFAFPLALAEIIDIQVGNKGLNFDPAVVNAKQGDKLNFFFYPENHSVAQSTFDKPCVAIENGPYSGFVPGDMHPKRAFQVTINSSDTLYLYCSKESHCNLGMAMIVNPPGKGEDLPAYLKAAKTANPTSPSAVAGGVFIEADANSTPSGSSASASATAASTSSASGASSTSSSSGSATSAAPATTSSAKSAAAKITGESFGVIAMIMAGIGALVGL